MQAVVQQVEVNRCLVAAILSEFKVDNSLEIHTGKDRKPPMKKQEILNAKSSFGNTLKVILLNQAN